MVLQVKNISFGYNKQKDIIKDFSLSINSNERVGIIAPSGFGKTTLCKIISGYIRPNRGEVIFDGKTKDFFSSENIRIKEFLDKIKK